jgi:hypothetical protein
MRSILVTKASVTPSDLAIGVERIGDSDEVYSSFQGKSRKPPFAHFKMNVS